MGNVVMEATQINYRRDETLKTVDQKLQELSETSAIDTDIAPVFKSNITYHPGDMVYYRNKLYVFTAEHTGAWASGDVTATDVSTAMNTALAGKADYADIAGAFSAETAYTAGDLVIYNGIIYRCTNDHTGEWDADDFSATTIGAELNAINSNISTLESGLINVDVALSVPDNSGKNLIPLSLDNFKTYNTDGTWTSNVYSENGIDFTVNTDASGAVTSISASGTASASAMIELRMDVKKGSYTLNGCPSGGSAGYFLQIYRSGVIDVKDRGDGAAVNLASDTNVRVGLSVGEGLEVTDLTFYPMLRDARITDATYTPYIPSVESRIEAVESGLTNLHNGYYRVNVTVAGESKWYKIAEHTATTWDINISTIAIGGSYLKRLTLRYDQTAASFDNDLTKIESIFGTYGRLAYKFGTNKVEVFWKAQRFGINTYTVLSESGNTPVTFQTPVLTDYVDADMDYIEPST